MIAYAPATDTVTIPESLLRLAKKQMNVTFTDDDQIIVWKIRTAIDLIERITSYFILRRTGTWLPTLIAPTVTPFYPIPADALGMPIPAKPVIGFTAVDENDVDISDDFLLYGGNPIDPATQQYLTTTTTTATPIVTLLIGYEFAQDIPPSLVDVVLRLAAYLYEFREMQNVPGVDNVAYANSLLSGYWMPRC